MGRRDLSQSTEERPKKTIQDRKPPRASCFDCGVSRSVFVICHNLLKFASCKWQMAKDELPFHKLKRRHRPAGRAADGAVGVALPRATRLLEADEFPARRARAMADDGGMAGGDGDAIAASGFDFRHLFGQLRADAQTLKFRQSYQARDTFGLLPAQRRDDSTEGDGAVVGTLRVPSCQF